MFGLSASPAIDRKNYYLLFSYTGSREVSIFSMTLFVAKSIVFFIIINFLTYAAQVIFFESTKIL